MSSFEGKLKVEYKTVQFGSQILPTEVIPQSRGVGATSVALNREAKASPTQGSTSGSNPLTGIKYQ